MVSAIGQELCYGICHWSRIVGYGICHWSRIVLWYLPLVKNCRLWYLPLVKNCRLWYLPLVKNCELWYLPLVKNCEFRYLSVGQTTLPLPAYGGAASSVPMLCKNNLTVTILVMFSHTTLHILTPEKIVHL